MVGEQITNDALPQYLLRTSNILQLNIKYFLTQTDAFRLFVSCKIVKYSKKRKHACSLIPL